MDENIKDYKIPFDADLLPAKDDQIFKSMLTRNIPESKIVLKSLLTNVTGNKVTEAIIRNNEPATDDINQKQERFDINCTIDNGEQTNIEMQCSHMAEIVGNNHRNCKNKSVYYGCDLFTSQSLKGKNYNDLAKTYQITFVAYTIFPEREHYVNTFMLRNDKGDILTDDIRIIFIELSKLDDILKKPVKEMSGLDMWAIFFEYADDVRYRKVINEIIEVKGEIAMASELLQSISRDEDERARFRSRRKFETDLESNIRTNYLNGLTEGISEGMARGISEGMARGISEGMAKGISEGMARGQIEMIRKMLLNGMSVKEIQMFSELSIGEIEKIKSQL